MSKRIITSGIDISSQKIDASVLINYNGESNVKSKKNIPSKTFPRTQEGSRA